MKLEFSKIHTPDWQSWDAQVAPMGREVWKAWYLSSISNGWYALQDANGHYYMPLFERTTAGIPFGLIQPTFLQSIPILTEDSDTRIAMLQHLDRSYFRFAIQTSERLSMDASVQEAVNLVLPLHASAEMLFSGFSENRRRNIRKLEKTAVCYMLHHDPKQLLEHFQTLRTANHWRLSPMYELHVRAILQNRPTDQEAFILEAYSAQGHFLAAGLFVKGSTRLTCILGASSHEGRACAAMSGIFWHLIQRHSNSSMLLDFEGGQLPGTGRFYREFGSVSEAYFVYRKKLLGVW